MTKINQEEYEVLKGLDVKWKWIARDENGEVWVYKSKPSKLEKEWDSGVLTSFNNNTLLQFIQWEDKEPYNIAELIEEYESEETEVRKDKQWAINELTKSMNFFKAAAKNGFSIEYFYGKELGTREAIQILKKLDETEIVPKQDLPVVPTWFDEWWKDIPKGEGNLLHNIDQFHDKLYSYGTREVYDYINDTGNKKKLLNIIINELEYEVEEEQKYYVLFGNPPHDDNWIYALTNSGSIEIFEKDVLPEWDRTKLTEQEIKDYDKRYWAFRKPVEELEK